MSIDYEKFIRSDYNTTINAVSSSEDSLLFKKINRYQNILEPVQIQDWKYSDPAYTRPRYEGGKSTSEKYTFYTVGDTSYGKSAAIDIITTKFAWANPTTDKNLNFYDKTSISIKYLIDITGSLTELSRKNNNWYEVQNLFKKGDFTNISLLDKTTPTNQSGLDGSKLIYESGYSYSPIVYRELNETLKFLYDTPKETTNVKLGVKSISTSSFVFETVGNTDTNFTDTTSAQTFFKIDGIDQPTTPFSFNRAVISEWPYTAKEPLTTTGPYRAASGRVFTNTELFKSFTADSYTALGGGKYFYTMDWFIPNQSGSSFGGYVTPDSAGAMKVNLTGGEWYSYFQAPRNSDYVVNVNIPIKITYNKNPDPGPSVVKLVAVVEKQEVGSIDWVYVASSKLEATNIPQTNPMDNIGIDSQNSSIYMDGDVLLTGNRNIQVSCIINGVKIGSLAENDKVRLRFYFVEVMNFFRRSENIVFEIGEGNTSKSYFEIYDEINSQITLDFDQDIIGTTSTYAMFEKYNDNTIEFDTTSSLLYAKSVFSPAVSTQTTLISDYYSGVESQFIFEPGDVVRFGTFFSVKPELYYIESVSPPIIQIINNEEVVTTPLRITLNVKINATKVNSRSFAFLKRRKDETSIILEYKRIEGVSSNSLIIPYNLDKKIESQSSNIISPIKDSILLKVLNG